MDTNNNTDAMKNVVLKRRDLKASTRLVGVELINELDANAQPTIRSLAATLGLADSTVRDGLNELERLGAISRTFKPGGTYTFSINKTWGMNK